LLPLLSQRYNGLTFSLAPIVRNAEGGHELALARWGMPGPAQYGGLPVTNIRTSPAPLARLAVAEEPLHRTGNGILRICGWEAAQDTDLAISPSSVAPRALVREDCREGGHVAGVVRPTRRRRIGHCRRTATGTTGTGDDTGKERSGVAASAARRGRVGHCVPAEDISQAAFDAVAATLVLGTVAVEPERADSTQRLRCRGR
jgi:hypothetical protein